ncbi:hypothetical protein CPB86DRAFT_512758 [Serendipita vermifera]|nr:hypothetical protein CPB86DRAFT_512758 [Serendipita vermifera]
MSQWQTLTPLQTQPLYLSLHNGSQETLEADDLISPELPPQSPVFDFDEFLNDSSSSKVSQSHQMSDTASVSTQLAVQRDNGSLGPWPTWDQTTVFHEETLNALQPSPSSFPQSASAINLSSSTMAPTSSFTHYPSFSSQQSIPFKFQDAQVASPQSILSTVYEARAQFPPSQSAPYQPPSASFSDYELGITGSVIGMENNNDLFQLGKMDDQQMQLNYHEIGRLPYGDSGYAGAHQSMYAPQSIHQSVSAEGRTGQRRVLVPRRDSSVPPYATDYRSSQSKAVFVASAPTPSMLSDISSLSPGSPRSVQGALSIPGSSPSITSVSPRYITPTSPTMAAQFSASPAQFSASPHQFVGASPAFIDASPITFVNQTAQYSTSIRSDEPTLSSAPESAGPKMFNPAKRRRPATSDAEEDSDEKRNEGECLVSITFYHVPHVPRVRTTPALGVLPGPD